MKNLTEYINEAGFDSRAQIAKNREIINKYFTDFTISAAFPIKKQKNYKKYFDYMYRCEISKKKKLTNSMMHYAGCMMKLVRNISKRILIEERK